MCNPGLIYAGVTLASAAVGAYSSIQSGKAAEASAEFNADMQRRNAQAAENEQVDVKDAAAIERRRLGERVRAERGDLNAKFSAMGVDPGFGTPADLTGDVKRAYTIDRDILGRNEMTAIKNLDKQRSDFTDAATLTVAEGKSARSAGNLGAAGNLLQGAANVSSKWIVPSTGAASAPSNDNTTLKKPQPTTRSPSVLKLGG